MSRKDYVKLVAVIASIKDKEDRKKIAEEFASICREDNPRFDKARFMKACDC